MGASKGERWEERRWCLSNCCPIFTPILPMHRLTSKRDEGRSSWGFDEVRVERKKRNSSTLLLKLSRIISWKLSRSTCPSSLAQSSASCTMGHTFFRGRLKVFTAFATSLQIKNRYLEFCFCIEILVAHEKNRMLGFGVDKELFAQLNKRTCY